MAALAISPIVESTKGRYEHVRDSFRMPEEDSVFVAHTDARAQVIAILRALQVPLAHAEITADALVKSSLLGVNTHGIGNIVRYAKHIQAGEYPTPQVVKVISEAPATALLSCGNSLRFVAAYEGMQIVINKARTCGIGMTCH